MQLIKLLEVFKEDERAADTSPSLYQESLNRREMSLYSWLWKRVPSVMLIRSLIDFLLDLNDSFFKCAFPVYDISTFNLMP